MIRIVANGVAMDLPSDLRIQLTIENPIFSTDRIPVAYTTNIDFPATQTNLKVFGFQDKLFIRPAAVKIPATLYVDELRIVDGMLCFDSFEDRMIRASFVGAQIEDFLSKDLSSVTMQQWLFGPLTNDEKLRYASLLESSAQGNEVFACGPVAITAYPNIAGDYLNDLYTDGSYYREVAIGNPATDHRIDFYGYQYPAVRLPYIIRQLLSDNVQIDGINLDELNDIVLITSSKIGGDPSTYQDTGGLVKVSDSPEQYSFPLSASMPKIQSGDLLKDLMKMFCLSIYVDNGQYAIRPNMNIINGGDFDDWSKNISEDYAISVEKGKSYQYGYSNIEGVSLPMDSVIEVENIWNMMTDVGDFKETTYFKIIAGGDIYLRSGFERIGDDGKTYQEYQFEMILPGGMEDNQEDDEETYDSMVKMSLSRSVMGILTRKDNTGGTGRRWINTLYVNESNTGERSSQLHIGIFIGRQAMLVQDTPFGNPENSWTTRGSYPAIVTSPYDMFGNKYANVNLYWGGTGGLFNLYHRQFAEWIRTDRVLFRTTVNLSVIDLKNLQLFRKKLIDGKKFLIRQIDVEIGHDGVLPADVQFVEAPDTE